jgi:RNA recognition motif-containing protein
MEGQEGMEVKVYVGNLPYDATEDELRRMFSQAGSVGMIDIIKDRDTGSPKGYAFITMGNQSEAEKAINMFNDTPLNNRPMKVNMARPREERSDKMGFWSGPTHRSRGGTRNRN